MNLRFLSFLSFIEISEMLAFYFWNIKNTGFSAISCSSNTYKGDLASYLVNIFTKIVIFSFTPLKKQISDREILYMLFARSIYASPWITFSGFCYIFCVCYNVAFLTAVVHALRDQFLNTKKELLKYLSVQVLLQDPVHWNLSFFYSIF